MCIFSSDLKENIHRNQVWVLLNFFMINYTSQEKTRPKNPVDLSNYKNHQSYYTCLSNLPFILTFHINFETQLMSNTKMIHIASKMHSHDMQCKS